MSEESKDTCFHERLNLYFHKYIHVLFKASTNKKTTKSWKKKFDNMQMNWAKWEGIFKNHTPI